MATKRLFSRGTNHRRSLCRTAYDNLIQRQEMPLFISAVSSCHMLFFLAIADFQGYQVESYEDNPVGYLESNDKKGKEMTRIELSPRITFGDDKVPDQKAIARIHTNAHKNCFIRNSITTEVTINDV